MREKEQFKYMEISEIRYNPVWTWAQICTRVI